MPVQMWSSPGTDVGVQIFFSHSLVILGGDVTFLSGSDYSFFFNFMQEEIISKFLVGHVCTN